MHLHLQLLTGWTETQRLLLGAAIIAAVWAAGAVVAIRRHLHEARDEAEARREQAEAKAELDAELASEIRRACIKRTLIDQD
jgi:hypothetical protein